MRSVPPQIGTHAWMNQKQRRVLDRLLWRRAHGDRSRERLVKWAAQALAEGLDSPHLRVLAGLSAVDGWTEIEQYFAQTLADFGLSEAQPGEVLLGAIQEAFPTEPLPARPVTGHRCFECDEVDEQLGGRLWVEVAECLPDWCHDAFPLLTAEAQLYYLPAYLEYELREPGSMAGHSIECALKRGEFRRETFTPAQREVLAAWLEYRADCFASGDPDNLAAYWRGAPGSPTAVRL